MYWIRLWKALLGRSEAAIVGEDDDASSRSRIASLELDLRERDERIETMQREYAHLEAAKATASAEAGQTELERLYKRLAGPMSNLATLCELARAGREVVIDDILNLCESLERELARAGMERIGAAGEVVEFDEAAHQRMSGRGVESHHKVVIRVPGYRVGPKVLLKAMVSAREA